MRNILGISSSSSVLEIVGYTYYRPEGVLTVGFRTDVPATPKNLARDRKHISRLFQKFLKKASCQCEKSTNEKVAGS